MRLDGNFLDSFVNHFMHLYLMNKQRCRCSAEECSVYFRLVILTKDMNNLGLSVGLEVELQQLVE